MMEALVAVLAALLLLEEVGRAVGADVVSTWKVVPMAPSTFLAVVMRIRQRMAGSRTRYAGFS